MIRFVEVCGGVPVRAVVAAARPPAVQTLAKVDPHRANLDARRADVEREIDLDTGLEMLAALGHVACPPVRPLALFDAEDSSVVGVFEGSDRAVIHE